MNLKRFFEYIDWYQMFLTFTVGYIIFIACLWSYLSNDLIRVTAMFYLFGIPMSLLCYIMFGILFEKIAIWRGKVTN